MRSIQLPVYSVSAVALPVLCAHPCTPTESRRSRSYTLNTSARTSARMCECLRFMPTCIVNVMQIFRVSKRRGASSRYSDSLLPKLCCVCYSIQELIAVSIGWQYTTPVHFSNRCFLFSFNLFRACECECVVCGAGFLFRSFLFVGVRLPIFICSIHFTIGTRSQACNTPSSSSSSSTSGGK